MILSKQDLKIHCESGVVGTAEIELLQIKSDCIIRFSFDKKPIDFVNYDFFECLIDLRLYLEHRKCFPLCNGARIDVHCGGMLREASKGCWGYILKGNENIVQDEDEVYIFDFADLELMATVDQQRGVCK
jgi:hypothetical protein